MKSKKGNINLVLLMALIVVLGSSVITGLAVKSKYDSKATYVRLENRYIAESGIDLSAGLFLNYLANKEFVLSYTKNEDGSYSVLDAYSPYILDEIRGNENADTLSLSVISAECNSYLSSIGYFDFSRGGGVEISISTFWNKDNFKLSRLCIEPNFLTSNLPETINKQSKINPIYLNIKSKYKGGEIMCNAIISNLRVVRQPFKEIAVGENASVTAHIDISNGDTQYQNYQNYRRTGL